MIFVPSFAQLPKNFRLEEFVSEEIFKTYGERAAQFIDPAIFLTVGYMRNTRFKKSITINDWVFGGKNHYRGYREPACTIGAANSLHRQGKGLDIHVAGMTGAEVQQDIIDNQDLYPFITCMERGTPHTHFDCRNYERYAHGIKVIDV